MIEFTFKDKHFTAYLKPDEKYDIYSEGLLMAMAVRKEFIEMIKDDTGSATR